MADILKLSDYASLAAALTAIGTTVAELWIDSDYTISSAEVIVPANITLKPAGGIITITGAEDSPGSLTIRGPFIPDTRQCFVYGPYGEIELAKGSTPHIFPQMFKADTTRAMLQAAVDVAGASNVKLSIPAGTYNIDGGLFTFRPIYIEGAGSKKTVIQASSAFGEGGMLEINKDSISSIAGWKLVGIQFKGSDSDDQVHATLGVQADYTSYPYMEDVEI